jgi:N-acetylglucosamine-6-sulfatase
MLVTLSIASPVSAGQAARRAAGDPPTVVLIVTDDQRWDTLWAMPRVRENIIAPGVRFTNGYVVNPVCCPSRASILTGLYSHSTGVYSNKKRGPHGGFAAFHDGTTIATVLHEEGYRTGLFGKYLNGYRAPYIPPGWDRWFATYNERGYYGYKVSDDGVKRFFGKRPEDYGTTVLAERATSFIENAPPHEPLFVYFAPHAPHAPATPAPGDWNAFRDLRRWRPKSYNERDMSDKPEFMRRLRRLSPSERRRIDRFRLRQYRSLLEVDRSVAAIVESLRATDRLSNALIVYTSDNGILWGEHRWSRKAVGFEEAVRVPFVVRYDPLTGFGGVDGHLVLNIDIAPTVAELAGTSIRTEGRSLVPLVAGVRPRWRKQFLIEHLGTHRRAHVPTFCAIHTKRYVLLRYTQGRLELYKLGHDPLELENRAGKRSERGLVRRAERKLRRLCSPPPPGYHF